MAISVSSQLNSIFQELIEKAESLDDLNFEVSEPVSGPKLELKMLESPKINSIVEGLEKAHEEGVVAVAEGLQNHLRAQIIAVGAVKTGELMNSDSVTIQSDSISVEYSSPYAAFVHYGGYIVPYGNVNISKVYIPGRPWIAASLGIGPGPLGAFDWKKAYTVQSGSSFSL